MNWQSRIRALREDNDYTQTQIAKILNVGQRTYADYELGKNPYSCRFINKARQIL